MLSRFFQDPAICDPVRGLGYFLGPSEDAPTLPADLATVPPIYYPDDPTPETWAWKPPAGAEKGAEGSR